MAMVLDLNKLEDRKLRSVDYSHKFMIIYHCVYNLERRNLFNDASKHLDKGDTFALQSPLIFTSTGVQTIRVYRCAYQTQYQVQDKKQFTIDFYQVRLYAGETTTSPSELIYSREGIDDGHHKTFRRYYVSTAGSSGISDGAAYPGDSTIDGRKKIGETINTEMFPGMFYHDVSYLGYKEYA
jgi:hypothetical protein